MTFFQAVSSGRTHPKPNKGLEIHSPSSNPPLKSEPSRGLFKRERPIKVKKHANHANDHTRVAWGLRGERCQLAGGWEAIAIRGVGGGGVKTPVFVRITEYY